MMPILVKVDDFRRETKANACHASYTSMGVSGLHQFLIMGLLQQAITWYKIRHTGGQAHYYSCTGTLKQRPATLDWLRSLCSNVRVWE